MIVRIRVAAVTLLVLAGCGLTGCSLGGGAEGSIDPTARVLVALPLAANAQGLDQFAERASDPDSHAFLHFRSLAWVARTFGAAGAVITYDKRQLALDGLQLALDPTHGSFWGVVSAAQVKRYFGVNLLKRMDTIYPDGSAHVPPGLKGVTGVVGLQASTQISNRSVSGGAANPSCPTSVATPSLISRVFGIGQPRSTSPTPPTVDILGIRTLYPTPVFSQYNRCAHTSLEPGSIDQLRVPATPATTGGYEVALDTLVLRMFAPASRLRVINFDPSAPLAFPFIESLVSGATPDVLSLNDASCETQSATGAIKLDEWLLAAFTATGTSVMTAAGDTGSSGCYPQSSTPAVQYPSSSAFATSLGGANYDGSANAPENLRVWNDPGTAGGGGGVSAVITAPSWQPPGPRRVPDVSAYSTPGGVGSIPVCISAQDCAWESLGGTSLASAVLAATLVSGLHRRWGDVAAGLWRAGRTDLAVIDVTSGSNQTFTTRCCAAGPGYDLASGWGVVQPGAVLRELDRLRGHG